jgi:outer membrane protein OmpA-like peptidoglycan-associated protein
MQLRFLLLSSVFLSLISVDSFALDADTLRLYFAFDSAKLDVRAQQKIDRLILNGTLSNKDKISIVAYADEPGENGYNMQLSQRRATEVRNYLISSGVSASDIQQSAALGESRARQTGNPEGYAEDRRVDVIIKKKKSKSPPSHFPPQEKAVFRPMQKKDTLASAKNTSIQTVQMGKPASKAGFSELKKGELINLDNIYFYPGRHIIRPESYAALDKLYMGLVMQENVQISIEGHVCCVPIGDVDAYDEDSHSLDLSLNRARFIQQYLLKKGIAANRMKVEGFGHRKPVVNPELTENDANKNRRVEIRVIN